MMIGWLTGMDVDVNIAMRTSPIDERNEMNQKKQPLI